MTNNMAISKPLINSLKAIGEDIVTWEDKIDARFIITNEVSFVISYNYLHIIREDVLELLPHKIVNFHISFLPWNRGSDPNIWSFIERTPCGVTIHEVDRGIDTGDILLQQSVVFDTSSETLATSYFKLHRVMQKLFMDNWGNIKANKLLLHEQVGQGSFHRKRDLDQHRDKIDYDESISRTIQKIKESNAII